MKNIVEVMSKLQRWFDSITTNKLEDMKSFYKVVIMNYLLKNGDAHLKNFGILYNDDFSKIWFHQLMM